MLDNYVIAYIDLLGVKNKISDDTFFENVHNLYQNTLDILQQLRLQQENIEWRIFSDNIVIARTVTEDINNQASNLNQIIAIAAIIQNLAIAQVGCLVRGGITINKFHLDEIMVWGAGLVEAYKLEGNHTEPTIVLSEKAMKIVNSNTDFSFLISRNTVGQQFVDYLSINNEGNYFINLHKNQIPKLKAEVSKENNDYQRTMSKYSWAIWYHNNICRKKGLWDLLIE